MRSILVMALDYSICNYTPSSYSQYSMMRERLYAGLGAGSCWADLVAQLHLQFTLDISYVIWK